MPAPPHEMEAPASQSAPGLLTRRPAAILAVSLLAVVLSLPFLARLRLETDPVSALPASGAAASDYRVFLETFGGLEEVFVLVEAPEGETLDADTMALVTQDLADLLSERPEVARARSGLDAGDDEFFLTHMLPRALLLGGELSTDEVRRRLEPSAIRERVASMKRRLTAPGGTGLRALVTADPLRFGEDLLRDRGGGEGLPVDPLTGAFLSEGGAGLVVLTPALPEMDAVGGRRLLAALRAAYETIREEWGLALRFREVGGPLYAVHDEEALRGDLIRTAVGTILVVLVTLLVLFGRPLPLLAVALSVATGLLWTGALVSLAFPVVSAFGVGLTSILVGLGVDYGIHGVSRFRNLRLEGRSPEEAVGGTLRDVGPPVLASAATTAAAFLLLALAHFRPLREMGMIVALGMALVLGATLLVGSSVLLLVSGRTPSPRPWPPWRLLESVVNALSGAATRRPALVLAAAGLLVVGSLAGASRLRLDTDPQRLRPDDHPLREAEAALAREFSLAFETSTVVVPGRTRDEALNAAERVRRTLRERLGESASIASPSEWILDEARRRERLEGLSGLDLEGAASILARELAAAGLRPEAFAPGLEALRSLGRGEDPAPPPREAWPDWLVASIRETETGAAAAVRVRVDSEAWPEGPPEDLLRAVSAAAPGSAFASVPRLGGELRRVARSDLSRLGLVSLGAVMLVVLLSFRGRPLPAALSCVPVVLGALWTFGLWGSLGLPLDLFCLATLPIVLGIGIDDGLHVLHGSRGRGSEGLAAPVRRAGQAMVVTTVTTSVGFGSLALSRIPSLRNGGLMVAFGVLACLAATLVVLPALDALLRGRRREGRA